MTWFNILKQLEELRKLQRERREVYNRTGIAQGLFGSLKPLEELGMEYSDITDRYGAPVELAEIERLETDPSSINILILIIDVMDKGRNYFKVRVDVNIEDVGWQDIKIHPYDLVKITEKYPIDVRTSRRGIPPNEVESIFRHIIKMELTTRPKKVWAAGVTSDKKYNVISGLYITDETIEYIKAIMTSHLRGKLP